MHCNITCTVNKINYNLLDGKSISLPGHSGSPLIPSLIGRPLALSTHQQYPVEPQHWTEENDPSPSHWGIKAPIAPLDCLRRAGQRGATVIPRMQERPHPLEQQRRLSSQGLSLLHSSTQEPVGRVEKNKAILLL